MKNGKKEELRGEWRARARGNVKRECMGRGTNREVTEGAWVGFKGMVFRFTSLLGSSEVVNLGSRVFHDKTHGEGLLFMVPWVALLFMDAFPKC